jgi:putative phosphoserine phosphatase/1-acylglycerol-3-phosphate O-acyltransferase
MLNVTNPPLVTVRVGEPITLDGDDVDANTEQIMSAIVQLLPPEAREPHTPTPEELALTYPHGKVPTDEEHTAEKERRPGSD